MSNNRLIDFLRDKNIRIIASKMPFFQNSIIDFNKASDFDIFNALCTDIYLLSGHPTKKRFLSLLSEYSKSEISCELLCDLNYQKALWKRIFLDSNIILPQSKSDINTFKHLSSIKETRIFCIDEAIDVSFDTVYDLLDNVLNKISAENVSKVSLDLKQINFARPDDFHAQKVYDKIKSSEEDASLLKLWLLCRILMNTAVDIELKADLFEDVIEILKLIFRLGLSPKVLIEINVERLESYDGIYEFLMLYNDKNISLEIYYPKEKTKIIEEFLKAVPMVFIESINSKAVK